MASDSAYVSAKWDTALEAAIREDAGAGGDAQVVEPAWRVLAVCLAHDLEPERIIRSTIGGVSFYFTFEDRPGYVNITVTGEAELLLTVHEADPARESSVREFTADFDGTAEIVRQALALVRRHA